MSVVAFTPPGGWELIAILFVFVLLFGAKKLPELGGSVGKSIKNFKKGMAEAASEDDEQSSTDEARSTEESPPAPRES